MLNKYEASDKLGRDIVINLFKDKVTFTEGGASDSFDLETDGMNGRSLIEIKYRPDLKSTAYDSDILEAHKLCRLKNEDPNAQHFYFMLFKDKVGRLYNLANLSLMDVYIHNIECPVSSVEDKGRIEKLMIDLPVGKAKVYRW